MSITEDEFLPSEEELTVPEVTISSPCLKAGAFHLGKVCLRANNEFVLCRTETQDPRRCIEEGKAVTSCTLKFFQSVKDNCFEEYLQYVHCIDKSSTNGALPPCRQTQGAFDDCMKDQLNYERPPHDYFARVQIHETERAKPEVKSKDEYPDRTPIFDEGTPKPNAKYGSRYLWQW